MKIPFLLKAITVTILLSAGRCNAANFSWVGFGGGDWSAPTNWKDGNGNPGVPGVNDSAAVGSEGAGGVPGGVNLTQDATVGNLSLFDTTLSVAQGTTLDVIGQANIEVSALIGPGKMKFENALVFNPAPASSGIPAINYIEGASVFALGSTVVSGSTELRFAVTQGRLINSGTITVTGGSLFNIGIDPAASSSTSGTGSFFDNAGTIEKIDVSGTAAVTGGIAFSNEGTVAVYGGELLFSGSATTAAADYPGEFDANGSGSIIEFACDTHLHNATTLGGYRGHILMDGSNQYSMNGTVSLGGTDAGAVIVTFGPDGAGNSGTLLVSGTVNLETGGSFSGNVFNWDGGVIASTGSDPVLFSVGWDAEMNIEGGGRKQLLGIGIETADSEESPDPDTYGDGIITWSGTGEIDMGSGATIVNDGSFEVSDDASILSTGTGTARFTNAGLFAKGASAAGAATVIAVPFDETGDITCMDGTLKFVAGSDGVLQTSTNTMIDVEGAGIVEFNGGVHDIVGGLSGTVLQISGNGTTIVDGDAVLDIGKGETLLVSGSTNPVLELDASGTIRGDGNLQVGSGPVPGSLFGTFNWNGGTLAGTGTTSIGGASPFAISGTNDKTLTGGRQLLNSGYMSWAGSGRIVCGDGVLIDNQTSGAFTISNDSQIVVTSTGGLAPRLTNEWRITKTSGTGTTLIGANVVNAGTIEIDTGKIEYGRSYSDVPKPPGGQLRRAGQAALLVEASGTAGTLFLEGGTAQFDSSTTINGNLAGTGTVIAPDGLINDGYWLTGKLEVIGNLTNQAIIQIGFLPEALTIDGDFTQGNSGDLVVPIDGTNPAYSEIGLLKVTGSAMLGGTLQAAFVDGFSPKVGERFGFLSAGSVKGHFSPIQVPGGAGVVAGSSHSLSLDVTHLNPSPVAAVAGRYDGLIQASGTATDATTGFITLYLNPSGSFSSTLKYGEKAYSLTGVFQTSGSYSGMIAHTSLAVDLSVDISNGTDTLTGTITDGTTNVTAEIAANRAVFNARTNPAPQRGRYTALIEPPADAALPQGIGYGKLSIDGNGLLKFTGKLGDGAAASQSVPISKQGLWPLFVTPYPGGGSISGEVTFRALATQSDLDGTLNWFKEPVVSATTGALYPGGFAAQVSLAGSHYSAPKKGASVLMLPAGTGDATITISGGGLNPAPAPIVATLGTNNKVVVTNPSGFKMTISLGTGLFTGSFGDSDKTYSFAGALFQKPDAVGFGHAGGEFSGANATGAIDLEANP